MFSDIITLSKECPGLQVSISLAELVEGINIAIEETKCHLEQTITDQKAETYPSRDKVLEILDISSATLYRWQKAGYLVPINVGGKRRYRMSDIKRILEGGAQKGAKE